MKEFEGFSVQQARTHQDTCDEEFVELMKKYRFRNHLAYYYSKCMGNNLESVQKEGQEGGNEIYYETGLELASKIGNDNCILVFYNMRIFLASILGKFSYAERYFQKCMPLIAKSSDKADLCANMNGLGYVTCVNGEYQKSANYFHEALKVEKEKGNTRLMAETIYNISITTLLAKDYANAARYIDMATEIIEIFDFDKIVSFMMVPYIKDNVVAGVAILYIVMKEEFRKISSIFDNEGLVMFRVAYRQMVDLIEKIDANETIKKMNESLLYVNKQLEESVVTDTLTGIYNREGYITKVREIEESEEIKDCIVLYFDLDNFKYYNDTFGHDVGDLVLVQLAKILQFLAEDNGIPIRYGGDEFLLIVPEITIEQAEAIAKEFYNILKQREYFIPKIEQVLKKKVDIPEEKQISSSIGIARTDYKVGRNIEKTVSYADTSLYDVKKSKKKNYRIWTPKDVK